MKLLQLVIIAMLVLGLSNTSYAQKSKRGTPDEAKAMVKKVKNMYATLGKEKTMVAVSKLSHNLRDRDLYPFIVHVDGWMAAHFIGSLRGLNFLDHTDSNGRFIFRSMIKVFKTKGIGWVTYGFVNPVTRKVEEKHTYLEPLDREFFVAVGVFSKPEGE